MHSISTLSIVLLASFTQAVKYKVILDRCEVVYFNESYIENPIVSCKTTASGGYLINSSAELKKAVNTNLARATGQLYIHQNGKYVPQPKLKLTLNVCDEYTQQSLVSWKEIEKYGNVKGCGILEAGHYYVKDYPPKIHFMDIPFEGGKYMANMKFLYDGGVLHEINVFTEVQY